jgi:putative nucleotidyltransferase with HDIG domain
LPAKTLFKTLFPNGAQTDKNNGGKCRELEAPPMSTIDQLLDQVEILPPSPALLNKLLLSINDVDANFDDVVNLIEMDPGLTAKLLQICNSAFFGPSEPIVTIRAAVSEAGYQAIYLLVAMIKGTETFKIAAANTEAAQIWRHSLVTAYATRFIAEASQGDSGAAFTAGLLHDIGKVVLLKANPDHYRIILKRAREARTSPFDFEIASHGFSHADVGAALLERWELPAALISGVTFHHNFVNAGRSQTEAARIYLGNVLAHGDEYDRQTTGLASGTALEILNLAPEALEQCASRVAANMPQVEQICGLA